MTRTATRSGSLTPVAVALVLASGFAASASETDRVAVEQLPHESPTEAALGYEEACFRIGVTPSVVQPIQSFAHGGVSYVRLMVSGPPLVLRCLNGLGAGRRAVDGTIHWFDGFAGGRLLPGGNDDRVPDPEWYDPTAAPIPAPEVDPTLVDDLGRGSAQARASLAKMPLDRALAQLHALIARGGPGPLAALEVIAHDHPHWSVRRAAIMAIDPAISAAVLMQSADHDTAWQVRLGAVDQLSAVANSNGPRAADARAVLFKILGSDPDWSVQREAIWAMSSAIITQSTNVFHALILRPNLEAHVSAAALEALARTRQIRRDEILRALADPNPEVRAIGAEILVEQLKPEDVPVLWKALNDPARLVRIAASPFLFRIDDATIAADLWILFLRESGEVDADPQFQHAILDTFVRDPTPQLASTLQLRLTQEISPDERRFVSRALGRMAPALALTILEPQLSSPDPLLRSVAADAVPDTATTRVRRAQLLQDEQSDVRAGAVIGLCRLNDKSFFDAIMRADLDPSDLGREAMLAAARCGQPEGTPTRIKTSLLITREESTLHGSPDSAFWPAIASILLILVSVVGVKLKGP